MLIGLLDAGWRAIGRSCLGVYAPRPLNPKPNVTPCQLSVGLWALASFALASAQRRRRRAAISGTTTTLRRQSHITLRSDRVRPDGAAPAFLPSSSLARTRLARRPAKIPYARRLRLSLMLLRKRGEPAGPSDARLSPFARVVAGRFSRREVEQRPTPLPWHASPALHERPLARRARRWRGWRGRASTTAATCAPRLARSTARWAGAAWGVAVATPTVLMVAG